jgi:N-acetyl-anhydromuramoyl-L-alanine amidase
MKIEQLPLEFFLERTSGQVVDTIVVHAMYHPDVPPHERFLVERCADLLNFHKASAHYLISIEGDVFRSVDEELRAKHAGESKMPFPDDSRDDVGDFSIGIELIGDWADPSYTYPRSQYQSLARLILAIAERYPIRNILGHDQISPGRKQDPGVHFQWRYLRGLLPPTFRFL